MEAKYCKMNGGNQRELPIKPYLGVWKTFNKLLMLKCYRHFIENNWRRTLLLINASIINHWNNHKILKNISKKLDNFFLLKFDLLLQKYKL
jgi:hypothetical protein